MRTRRESYKTVVDLAFSYDNWSHLLAVFSDGTVTLYSAKSKSKEMSAACAYAAKDVSEEAALDLSDLCTLTYAHLITDQDKFIKDVKQELHIVSGTFHPSFDLFGLQKSVVVAAASTPHPEPQMVPSSSGIPTTLSTRNPAPAPSSITFTVPPSPRGTRECKERA